MTAIHEQETDASFSNFIRERLDMLQDDLLQWRDRTVTNQELQLRAELDKAHMENDALRRKMQGDFLEGNSVGKDTITSIDDPRAEGGVLLVLGEPADGSCQREEASLDKTVQQDRSNCLQLNQESRGDHNFHLWSEWTQPVGKVRKKAENAENPHSHFDCHHIRSPLEHEWLSGHRGHNYEGVKSSFTVTPNSCLALVWDLIGLPVLLYDLVTLPLSVFWKPEGNEGDAITWCLTLYWTADIFLRLLVIGFMRNNGHVELKRIPIMLHYLKSAFLFDIVMVVPDWISVCFDLPRRLALLRVFRLMRFMRILRMSKLRQYSRDLQDLVNSEYMNIHLNISWNMVLILSSCHYLGCLWYWVSTWEVEDYQSWIGIYLHRDDDWVYAYLTSLHWAICQFTPGSMKVQPWNPWERVVSILVLLWGIAFFALFVSSITQERMRLRGLHNKMERDNWVLRSFMRQSNISRHLSTRVLDYVDVYVGPRMHRLHTEDVVLIKSLSEPLQMELQAEIHSHMVSANFFLEHLKETCNIMASKLLTCAVADLSYAKDDVLFEVGQTSHQMLHVDQGLMGYLNSGSDEPSAVCSRDDWCCEQVIWVPWVHMGTARAAVECHIFGIDSAIFRRAVLEYSERAYVVNCAHAYLEDLNACVLAGLVIDDLVHMDQRQATFFDAVNTGMQELF